MKKLLHCLVLFLLTVTVSCKKEASCEGCATKNNKPPISVSGPDKVITLPTDSLLLDGRSSSDPDGRISTYLWTKIAGPSSFTILKPTDSLTTLKTLVAGVYQFELKVTDDGGLSSKDTMRVIVDPVLTTNHPPIANAGVDQTITLPTNTINLDGSASTDPENSITTYVWTKVSGPSSFNIVNSTAVQTQLTNLIQGVYQLELKVTDAGGLFSKDTMQVTVNIMPPPSIVCNPINRPIVNAQLVPFGTLSEARTKIAVASAGNKILFAGGQTSAGAPSSTVDIYDITTQLWSTTQLSVARYDIAAISAGNKIYFAGGISTNYALSSRIDIYDVGSNSWSITELSEARSDISAATVGNKIMFAGGFKNNTCTYCTSDKVDIYDISTNSWSTATLGIARVGLSATTAGNKIYFAGGHEFWGGWSGTGVYDQIDIYDNTTNTWSTSVLSERKAHHGAFAIGNYIYWAGGEIWNNLNDYETTCKVEKRNLLSGTSTIVHLFQPSYANSNDQPRIETLSKNGAIVFYTGGSQFDIYDPVADLWSIGIMNQGFNYAGVISVNNIIYIAGGGFPYYTPSSNQVWKLQF